MIKGDKQSIDANSSAENVEQYLQELEKADYELLYYSQEQIFSADELASVINEAKLNELLTRSDAFVKGLSSEIDSFEDNTFGGSE